MGRKERTTFTPDVKRQAIADIANGMSRVDVAKKYGASRPTVILWWKQRDQWAPGAGKPGTPGASHSAATVAVKLDRPAALELMLQLQTQLLGGGGE